MTNDDKSREAGGASQKSDMKSSREYHRLRRRRGTIYVIIGLMIGAVNLLLQQTVDSAVIRALGSSVLGVYFLFGAAYVLLYDTINEYLGWPNE